MTKSNPNTDYDFDKMKSFLIGDDEYPPTSNSNSNVPFDLEELKEIPYYKKPLVQLLVVFGTGISVIYLTLLAFKTDSPSIAQATPVQLDQEKQNLLLALQKEQDKTRELELQNALLNQQELVVSTPNPQPKTKTKTKPKPTPVAKTTVTTPPQTVSTPRKPQPTYKPIPPRRPQPQPVAKVEPQPIVNTAPQVDPMTQWLAIADQGHYTTAHVTKKTSARLVSKQVPEIRQPSSKSDYPLPNDSQVSNAIKDTTLLNDEELVARINGRTRASKSIVTQRPQAVDIARSSNKMIDIGSSAKATLESAVVWSSGSNDLGDRKYLLRLKEDFKNIDGKTILAEDTRLIAQVKSYSGSGIVNMEITQIISDGQRINVTPGSLVVEGKKGSPLKADLKQKGDSDFWGDVASTVAPGIERALDNTSDTIVVQNGSVFRNDTRDPLANGISGVIDGANTTLNRRLNNQPETVASYFELSSNKTVYLKAYEDISL